MTRVATINMAKYDGEGRHDVSSRWGLLADQCTELQPDILAIQEAVHDPNYPKYLADQLGKDYQALDARTYPPGDLDCVTSIITRLPVISKQITRTPGLRATQIVELETDQGPLVVGNQHMPWRIGHEMQRLAIVRALMGTLRDRYPYQSTVVVGDFNSLPWMPNIRRMRKSFYSPHKVLEGHQPKTYPTSWGEEIIDGNTASVHSLQDRLLTVAKKLRMQNAEGQVISIDYIFATRDVNASAAGAFADKPIDDAYVSDHIGLWADVEPVRL